MMKEYYLFCFIFEEYFVIGFENGDCVYVMCLFGKFIVCFILEVVCWDFEWEKSVGDIFGRAVKNVYVVVDKFDVKKDGIVVIIFVIMMGVWECGVCVKVCVVCGVS